MVKNIDFWLRLKSDGGSTLNVIESTLYCGWTIMIEMPTLNSSLDDGWINIDIVSNVYSTLK